MNGRNRSLTRSRAFTLIELLVVIAIIAVLAAILFPVFAQARDKARAAACLSNEKQIGNAMMMYAQDYEEMLPAWNAYYAKPQSAPADTPAAQWEAKLQPYIKDGNADDPVAANHTGVWHCPDLGVKGEREFFLDASNKPTTRYSYSYGMNAMVSYTNYGGFSNLGSSYYRYPLLPEMDQPASTIFVGECGYPGRIGAPMSYQTACKRTVQANIQYSWEVPDRHAGGANYIFMDGHAKWLKSEAAYPPAASPCSPSATDKKVAYKAAANYFAYSAAERQDCLLASQ